MFVNINKLSFIPQTYIIIKLRNELEIIILFFFWKNFIFIIINLLKMNLFIESFFKNIIYFIYYEIKILFRN